MARQLSFVSGVYLTLALSSTAGTALAQSASTRDAEYAATDLRDRLEDLATGPVSRAGEPGEQELADRSRALLAAAAEEARALAAQLESGASPEQSRDRFERLRAQREEFIGLGVETSTPILPPGTDLAELSALWDELLAYYQEADSAP